ncbi:MAG: NAD(P)-dependent oxidoreductase [Acidimicrobiales bacterium]
MAPRSVFVTGAAGFIGRTVAQRYRSHGAEVRGVDVVADEAAGVVAGDVAEAGPWQDHAAGCDLLVHTAAIVNNSAPLARCWEVNVLGVRRALDAAVAGGVGRVVHLSSVRAFSDLDFPDGVDESHPVRPDGHRYVDTKVASEQVALQAHAAGEVDVTVIRPGDVYGPGSIPWTLWPVTGMASGAFVVPDDGSGIFSPVYVDNLVDAIVAAAELPEAAGQVFTVSDGVGVTNAAFFGRYAAMLGIDLPMLPADEVRERFQAIEEADRAAGRPPGLNAETVDYFLRTGTYSIAKARRVLGYEPRVDLDEGMARTEAWLREVGLLG